MEGVVERIVINKSKLTKMWQPLIFDPGLCFNSEKFLKSKFYCLWIDSEYDV